MSVVLKPLIAVVLLGSPSAAEEQLGEFATRPPITFAPTTRSPSNTFPPTPNGWPVPQQCSVNNDEWRYPFRRKVDGGWWVEDIGCDDSRVACDFKGNIGFAREHCCKCKVACLGQCNDPVYTPTRADNIYFIAGHDSNNGDDFDTIYAPVLALVLILVCCFGLWIKGIENQRDLLATRQTMAQRRQQQRESSYQVLSEEESKNARYELFVTKFHFQMVLPDKSNITADRVRNIAGKQDEECLKDEKETESEADDDSTATSTHSVENRFPERLSCRLGMPEAKDECCICLESYTEGETICAPITTNCNHLFHKDCIYEWLKTRDLCPLCRVELLKD